LYFFTVQKYIYAIIYSSFRKILVHFYYFIGSFSLKDSSFEKWQEATHITLIDDSQCPCAKGDIEHCFLSLSDEAQIALFETSSVMCFMRPNL